MEVELYQGARLLRAGSLWRAVAGSSGLVRPRGSKRALGRANDERRELDVEMCGLKTRATLLRGGLTQGAVLPIATQRTGNLPCARRGHHLQDGWGNEVTEFAPLRVPQNLGEHDIAMATSEPAASAPRRHPFDVAADAGHLSARKRAPAQERVHRGAYIAPGHGLT